MSAKDAPSLAAAFASTGSFHELRGVCPHCGAISTFQNFGEMKPPRTRVGDTRVSEMHFGRCPGCESLVVGVGWAQTGTFNPPWVLWPRAIPADKSPAGLDPNFKKVYDQARNVFSLSPMASAVLARRCLQHVIRTQLAITRKTLFDEIAEAVKRDELSKPTRDALDHVRTIGNWGAHPVEDQSSTLIDVTQEEAEYTLNVLELLFNDLYVVPQRTAAMQAKIQAKK